MFVLCKQVHQQHHPPRPQPKDTDGDGVIDSLDQCPGTPAGTKVDSRGCPLPPPPPPKDSDGDGVYDNLDACPNTPKGFKVDAWGCALRTIGRASCRVRVCEYVLITLFSG